MSRFDSRGRVLLLGLLAGACSVGLWALLRPRDKPAQTKPKESVPQLLASSAPELLSPPKTPPTLTAPISDVAELDVLILDSAREKIPGAYAYWSDAGVQYTSAVRIPLVPGGGGVRLRPLGTTRVAIFGAPDHLSVGLSWAELVALPRIGSRVEVLLGIGHVIRGRVRDPSGEPISGARIEAFADGVFDSLLVQDQLPGPPAIGKYQLGTSDERGEFEVSGISTLPVRLRVQKVHYVRDMRGTGLPLVTDSTRQAITLYPLVRVGLRVVDEISGELIPAVKVLPARFPAGMRPNPYPIGTRPSHVPLDGIDPQTGARWTTFRVGVESGSPATTFDEMEYLVSAPSYSETVVRVPVKRPNDVGFGEPHEIRLARDATQPESATLRITVKTGLADELHALRIGVRNDEAGGPLKYLHAAVDAERTASIELPPGRYTVEVIPAAVAGSWWLRGRRVAGVDVHAGTGGRVTIALGVGIARFRVTGDAKFYKLMLVRRDGDKRRVFHRTTSLMIESGDEMREFRRLTNSNSRHFDVLLPSGEYVIGLVRNGKVVAEQKFQVDAGASVAVPLKIPQGD